MARIKIKDLPKNMKISRSDLGKIRGGKVTALLNSPEIIGTEMEVNAALAAAMIEIAEPEIEAVKSANKEGLKVIAEMAEREQDVIKSLSTA